MPVQRLKVAILPLDLPCSGPVTYSAEILTTGKSQGKKPDRFSLNDNMDKLFFYVLLAVHFSIFISVINQLDKQNLFYNKFISCLYMFGAHVLIIRRSKLYYTASGIITPVGVMIPEAV